MNMIYYIYELLKNLVIFLQRGKQWHTTGHHLIL